MHWGWKSRFHDIDKVIEFNPSMVEFHLTDDDVEKGELNCRSYNCDYSIHLPEYWHQELIDPCNLDNFQCNYSIYRRCIEKGLSLKNKFDIKFSDWKLKVIMHPGGMTVDPITDESNPIKFYRDSLYKRLISFVTYLEMIPEFKNRIEILVENMPPLPWFYGGQYYSNIFCDPIEIGYFCKSTNHNFCLDISHLGLYCNYIGINLIDSINQLLPYVKQIHLADAEGTDGEGAPFGSGDIDFESVIKTIKHLNVSVIPETMWGHKNSYYEFQKTIRECNKWLT